MIISSLGRASNSIVPFCLKKSDENHKTFLWWKLLCCISVFNLLIWSWTYLQFQGQPNPTNYQKWHLVLSGIYTCVCAYRSVLPRIDLERYCLFDSQWSSVALGRTAATIAEISFACQLGLLLHEWGDTYDHPLCKFWSFVVPPLLGLAQVFCWCGVVSGNHVYHAIEESLWAVAFTGIFLVTTVFTIYGYAEIFELALLGAVLSAGTNIFYEILTKILCKRNSILRMQDLNFALQICSLCCFHGPGGCSHVPRTLEGEPACYGK